MFWGNEDLALIYESEWKSRRSVVSTFAPGKPEQGLQVLFDRYTYAQTPRCSESGIVQHEKVSYETFCCVDATRTKADMEELLQIPLEP